MTGSPLWHASGSPASPSRSGCGIPSPPAGYGSPSMAAAPLRHGGDRPTSPSRTGCGIPSPPAGYAPSSRPNSPASRLFTPTLSSLAKSRPHHPPSERKALERMPAATSPNASPNASPTSPSSPGRRARGRHNPSPPLSPPDSPLAHLPALPRAHSPPSSPRRLTTRSPFSPSGPGERKAISASPAIRRNSPPSSACGAAEEGESLATRLRRQVQEQQRLRHERRQQQQQQRMRDEQQRNLDERSDWPGSPRITLMAAGRQEPIFGAKLTDLRRLTVESPDEVTSDDSSSVNDSGSVNETSSGSGGEWESDGDSFARVKHLRYKLAASPVSVLDLEQQRKGSRARGGEYDSDTVTPASSGELNPSLVLEGFLLSARTAGTKQDSPSLPPSSSPSFLTTLSPHSPSSECETPPPSHSAPPPSHSLPTASPPLTLSLCPAESLALLDLSTTGLITADVAGGEGLADVAGIEQDLEYVRHVLLLSGFAGEALPPLTSIQNLRLPIRREVFEQLESEITGENGSSISISSSSSSSRSEGSGSDNGSSSVDTSGTKGTEERRQRMLLFDAANEALGRTLAPFLNPTQWDLDTCPSSAARLIAFRKLDRRPMGKELLRKVWVEIHDWPIPPSADVYDVLDDAARRDMLKGVDRWSPGEIRDSEAADVAFQLENMLLDAFIEAACKEYREVERERVERRRLQEVRRKEEKEAREAHERERLRKSFGWRGARHEGLGGNEVREGLEGLEGCGNKGVRGCVTPVRSGSAGRMGRVGRPVTPQRGVAAGSARSSSIERGTPGKGVRSGFESVRSGAGGLNAVDRTSTKPSATAVRSTTPVRQLVSASGAGRFGAVQVGQRQVGGVGAGEVDRRWRK